LEEAEVLEISDIHQVERHRRDQQGPAPGRVAQPRQRKRDGKIECNGDGKQGEVEPSGPEIEDERGGRQERQRDIAAERAVCDDIAGQTGRQVPEQESI
jgi:hypothetical protein